MLDPKQVKASLYDPSFEQDSCGVGFVARPSASPGRDIVEMALEAVANLTHRGAVDADAKTGGGGGATPWPATPRLAPGAAGPLGAGRQGAGHLPQRDPTPPGADLRSPGRCIRARPVPGAQGV